MPLRLFKMISYYIVGSTVRNKIISDIVSAYFFSILADEVTDCSNQEQLSLAT